MVIDFMFYEEEKYINVILCKYELYKAESNVHLLKLLKIEHKR